MRVMLIHTPKKIFEDGVLKQFQIMIPALGIWPLASMLFRNGHEVKIVHTGIEELLDEKFSLSALVRKERADFVCFSLHWHHQLHEVFELSSSARIKNPDVKIALGGITATAFAEEILGAWTHIDFILRGEAESALLELINSGASCPEKIPGLSWRKPDGSTAHNSLPQCNPEISEEWSYICLEKMRNFEFYSGSYYYDAGETSFETLRRQERIWYLYAGRGCPANCSFCGGGNNAHRETSGRNTVSQRKPVRIAADMVMMREDFNTKSFALCFHPPGMKNEYYEKLFSLLPPEQFSMIFEYYNRQRPESFINSFSKAFISANSRIVFSPTAFSVAARRKHCPSAPDDGEIEFALKTARKAGVKTTLFYAPLPMEPEKDFLAGLDTARRKLDKYKDLNIVIMPVEIEPLSPWHTNPGKYGLKLKRETLEDFTRHHSERKANFTGDDLGYGFKNFEAAMSAIKSASSDPRWSLFFPYMFNPVRGINQLA